MSSLLISMGLLAFLPQAAFAAPAGAPAIHSQLLLPPDLPVTKLPRAAPEATETVSIWPITTINPEGHFTVVATSTILNYLLTEITQPTAKTIPLLTTSDDNPATPNLLLPSSLTIPLLTTSDDNPTTPFTILPATATIPFLTSSDNKPTTTFTIFPATATIPLLTSSDNNPTTPFPIFPDTATIPFLTTTDDNPTTPFPTPSPTILAFLTTSDNIAEPETTTITTIINPAATTVPTTSSSIPSPTLDLFSVFAPTTTSATTRTGTVAACKWWLPFADCDPQPQPTGRKVRATPHPPFKHAGGSMGIIDKREARGGGGGSSSGGGRGGGFGGGSRGGSGIKGGSGSGSGYAGKAKKKGDKDDHEEEEMKNGAAAMGPAGFVAGVVAGVVGAGHLII